MTLLPSTSPGIRLMVGFVVVVPLVSVTGPCALRKPSADATTVYEPGLKFKLKVPSGFAGIVAARLLSRLYKRIVTGLLAITCPVSWVGALTVVAVTVGVGVPLRIFTVSPTNAILS
jgi:hypothetical protein